MFPFNNNPLNAEEQPSSSRSTIQGIGNHSTITAQGSVDARAYGQYYEAQQIYIDNHTTNHYLAVPPSKRIATMEDKQHFVQVLRSSYQTQGAIPRLFKPKASFSLENCYINLAITEAADVTQEEDKLAESNPMPSDNKRDAGIDTFEALHNPKNSPIKPDKLFESDKSKQNQSNAVEAIIKRILIIGRAGVGKSTLCRYLAYQWARGELWKEETRFTLVVWVPLRDLATYAKKYPSSEASIAGFLCQQGTLSEGLRKENLTADLIAQLLDNFEKETLYILDGYDEIGELPQMGENSHPIWSLISLLKQKPQWVITTRPYHLQQLSVDRHFEIMGFLNQDIPHYIQHYFHEGNDKKEHKKGERLQTYLSRNRAIWGIAHIPIQLELICFVWQQEYKNEKLDVTQITMTKLYTLLHGYLLRRYFNDERSQLRYPGHHANKTDNHRSRQCQKEMTFLEQIALQGLINGELLIPSTIIRATLDDISANSIAEDNASKIDLSDILKIGVLKGVGEGADIDKSYYFLHLTFQEYYAALHIAKVLLEEVPWCLEKYADQNDGDKTANKTYSTVFNFIKRHQYEAQYEVIWWFVSGLLAEKNQAKRLFERMDASPTDILGLRNALLTIRLLEESRQGLGNEAYQKKQIAMLGRYGERVADDNAKQKQLTNFTRRFIQNLALSPWLVRETTLLKPLLTSLGMRKGKRVIKTKSAITKHNGIHFLELLGRHHMELGQDAIALLKHFASEKDNTNEEDSMGLSNPALQALQQQARLSEAVQLDMIALLYNKGWRERQFAVEVLKRPMVFTEAAESFLLNKLYDGDWDVRDITIEVLLERDTLSQKTQGTLVEILKRHDKNVEIRRAASTILQNKTMLGQETQLAFVQMIAKDDDWIIIDNALQALQRQSLFNAAMTYALFDLFITQDELRHRIIPLFQKSVVVDDRLQLMLIEVLEISNPKQFALHQLAIQLLQKPLKLSDAAERALIHFTSRQNKQEQNKFTAILEKQLASHGLSSSDLMDRYQSNEAYTEEEQKCITVCIENIQKQQRLKVKQENQTYWDLKNILSHQKGSDNETIEKALSHENLTHLSQEIQSILIETLYDNEKIIKEQAKNVLEKQKNLSLITQEKLINALSHKSAEVRQAAQSILAKHNALSESIQERLLNLMYCRNDDVVSASKNILAKQIYLSEKTQCSLIRMLCKRHINDAAQHVLQQQKTLHENPQTMLIELLSDEPSRDEYRCVINRDSIFRLLINLTNLCEEAEWKLIQLLRQGKTRLSNNGYNMMEILKRKTQLSVKTQAALNDILCKQNTHKDVLNEAIRVLQEKTNLSKTIQMTLLNILSNATIEWNLKHDAAVALSQHNLAHLLDNEKEAIVLGDIDLLLARTCFQETPVDVLLAYQQRTGIHQWLMDLIIERCINEVLPISYNSISRAFFCYKESSSSRDKTFSSSFIKKVNKQCEDYGIPRKTISMHENVNPSASSNHATSHARQTFFSTTNTSTNEASDSGETEINDEADTADARSTCNVM